MATTPQIMANVYTGATGFLTLEGDNTNAPEGADATTILGQTIYGLASAAEVGRVTGVEVHVNTDLQGYYQIGQRHPVSLHPENIHISGKVNRAYINGALLFLLLGKGANPKFISEDPAPSKGQYPQPALIMHVNMADPAVPGSAASLVLHGVKFENWAFSMPEDDFVMENVTFKALRVEVDDAFVTTGKADVGKPNTPFSAGS
jgi:hypothetical protein